MRRYIAECEPKFNDTGCKAATDYLDKQSRCLDCPFEECVEVLKDKTLRETGHHLPSSGKEKRNDAIRAAFWIEGKLQREIAVEFNLSVRTIVRILKEKSAPSIPVVVIGGVESDG